MAVQVGCFHSALTGGGSTTVIPVRVRWVADSHRGAEDVDWVLTTLAVRRSGSGGTSLSGFN